MPTRSSHTSWPPYFRFRTVSGCHHEKLRGGTYLILLSAASVPIDFANSWLKETSSMIVSLTGYYIPSHTLL
jgi:hypothetical protein